MYTSAATPADVGEARRHGRGPDHRAAGAILDRQHLGLRRLTCRVIGWVRGTNCLLEWERLLLEPPLDLGILVTCRAHTGRDRWACGPARPYYQHCERDRGRPLGNRVAPRARREDGAGHDRGR